jgi:pentatricopeptide repeat protein
VKALTFLDSMKMADVPPDAVAYSAAIEACARGGLHDKALAIFEELKQAGFRPSPQVGAAVGIRALAPYRKGHVCAWWSCRGGGRCTVR